MRYRLLFCSTLLLAAACAHAEDPPVIAQVQVSGSGADQLIRQGDSTLADALKRLPGISIAGVPGQGGEIRMHGLGNGYTQIMLNGVPVPAGFALDSIAPELIERVDIVRAATADASNQALAGSINIVLRKAVARGRREWSAGGAGGSWSPFSPTLSTQLSDRVDDFSYTLAATLTRTRNVAPTVVIDRQLDPRDQLELLRRTPQTEASRDDALVIAPRLSWKLADGATLTSQNYVNLRHLAHHHVATETDIEGGPSDFPDSVADYAANSAVLRSDADWNQPLANGATLDVKLAVSASRRRARFRFDGADLAGQPSGRHDVASGPAEDSVTASGSYRLPLGERQALAFGWDGSRALRREYRREQQYGATGAPLDASDASYQATVTRLALYAQDEWDITPRWSLYAGLRRETLATVTATVAAAPADTRSGVWSPSLQALYKLSGRDQLRVALSRSYKAPKLADLVPRRYTTDNANSATNPDTQGNPALRPELAWGLDAAVEHYLGRDGATGGALLSASAYARRIGDVTQQRLYQSAGVWIESPVNDGKASVRGIELEAKLPLQAVAAQAQAVDVRANVARNWSSVDCVAGPDNRLDGQLPLSANLGLDYRLRAAPLTVGASFNFQAGGAVRVSSSLSTDSSPKRGLDLYALYRGGDNTRLRVSVANLLSQPHKELVSYSDDSGTLRKTTRAPTSATLRILIEHPF
ncbi:TonB-dependent receptor [Rugamonas sp.]|uniref:TonB-dependent receptor plug domain-containing protein n=1 Tax=Rugamonas sp. TaxID=1926287 RepID=UPI0025DC4111|nr:TonB-dependent receptor [Rugamonas sp.]